MSSRQFLGRGWKYPFRVDSNGRVVTATLDDKIRESIWLILSTAPGERVMRPEFGCGIHDMVFEAISSATLHQVETIVFTALSTFERRVDILNVVASAAEVNSGKLVVTIDYRVRETNDEFNLVFPFLFARRSGLTYETATTQN